MSQKAGLAGRKIQLSLRKERVVNNRLSFDQVGDTVVESDIVMAHSIFFHLRNRRLFHETIGRVCNATFDSWPGGLHR